MFRLRVRVPFPPGGEETRTTSMRTTKHLRSMKLFVVFVESGGIGEGLMAEAAGQETVSVGGREVVVVVRGR